MNEETKDCARLPVVAWWLKNSGGEKDLVGLGSGEHIYQGAFDEKIFLCRLTDAQARLAEKDARIAQLAAHARGKNKALANALKEIERLKRTIEAGAENEIALVGERTELRAQLAQLQAAPAERVMIAEVAELYCPEAYGFEGPETFPDCGTCVVCLAKSIMANGGLSPAQTTAAQPWIPVGERLPETETAICVLVYRPDAHEMPANDPNVTIKRYSNEGGFSSIHKVTHWMPLPAAPATADSDVREVKP